MFHFEKLPQELKEKILEFFFVDDDNDPQRAVIHHAKEYIIPLFSSDTDIDDRPLVKQPEKGGWYHLDLTIRLHHNFLKLFLSKSFLHSTLPVFARLKILEFCSMRYRRTPIPGPSKSGILGEVMHALIPRLEILEIRTGQEWVTRMPPFRGAFPRLQTLILQDSEILIWSRFAIRQPRSGTAHSSRDVFQTPEVAPICGSNSRRVICRTELERLKSEDRIFPGDLAVLCQYIKDAAGCDYPRVIHRICTIVCYANEQWSGKNSISRRIIVDKRRIVINLTIDVRAVTIVAVDVRDQAWVENQSS